MKKLLFACCVLCCFIGFVRGDILSPSSTFTTVNNGGGQICNKDATGKVVCRYIDVGGGYEENLCYETIKKDTDLWKGIVPKKNGKTGEIEIGEDSYKKHSWDKGYGIKFLDGNSLENAKGIVMTKSVGTDCTKDKPGAKLAKCIENTVDKKKNKVIISCAAYECLEDYLLYTTNIRKEIPVVGRNQKVGSQGLCRKKSDLIKFCDAGCGCDKKTEKCVLNEVTVTNHKKDVKAFIGEELCVCEKTSSGGEVVGPDEKECWYEFTNFIECTNGRKYLKEKRLKLTEKELGDLSCGKFKEMYKDDSKEVQDMFKIFCEDDDSTIYVDPDMSTSPNDAAVTDAINKINTLMGNVTVWRDAEGKFNTARLASDATAGVVLGTVGGIVSSKIIKKKQLEKGFDVLHCTIGGQKVADYGDIFQVSYHK